MQNQCSVCAVTPGIVDTDAPMLVLKPKTLEGVLDDVERVAAAVGAPARGAKLRKRLDRRLAEVRADVAEVARGVAMKPRVALLEWCAPIMGCADWLPEIVELAGGVPVHAAVDGKTPTLWGGVEELLSTPLDAIVLALCGFDASRVARELRRCPELLAALRGLEASGDTGVWVTDGSSLFNRSGPRVVESAEVLAEALHNGLLGHYGHAGTPYLLSLEETLALYPPEDGTDVPSAAAAAAPTPARAAAVAGSAVGVEREKAPSPPKGKEARVPAGGWRRRCGGSVRALQRGEPGAPGWPCAIRRRPAWALHLRCSARPRGGGGRGAWSYHHRRLLRSVRAARGGRWRPAQPALDARARHCSGWRVAHLRRG